MTWLKTILCELIGLFVDDVGFALAIFGWITLVALGLPRLGLHGNLPALILFIGLLGILLESTIRRARK